MSYARGKIFHREVSTERAGCAREMLGEQIGQNFLNITNRQRVMSRAFDQVELAIRKTRRDGFRQPVRKCPVLRPVPKRDGHAHLLELESPWCRVDLSFGH